MKASTNCTRPQYVCGNEKIKLIGGIDGYFPDFGHHLENEMGGLWLFPVKLLDGFWMRFTDHTAKTVDCYMKADKFENHPHKNVFSYGAGLGHTTVTAQRIQMAPEGIKGILVKYVFKNRGKEASDCTTEMLARVNMKPVWLSEELGIYAGDRDDMVFREEDHCFLAKDSANPWFTVIGCDSEWDESKTGNYFGPENTVGNGVSCVMTHHFVLEPGMAKEMTFYFAGSELSEEDAINNYRLLHQDKDFESEKEDKYREILEKAQLIVEDKRFQNIYDWAKVNTDWLTLDQETYGRGIVAGLPEYPWWFGCDSFYTLQGILGIGNAKLCRDTLKLIKDYSEKINGNGRIVHEILPNGYCPNPGNTQETAHFVTMVWKYFDWTGDREMLEECLPYIRKSIAWLQEQDEDGDMYPSGYGIIEIAGLNMEMIDTAVYTCEAYECFSKMLELIGEKEEAEKFINMHHLMKEKINRELWDDEAGLYCDDDALRRRIELIEWTFDPLEIKNAWLNLESLGAIARRYIVNQYGMTSSPLQGGLPSDRFVAEWWLKSRRVETTMREGRHPVITVESRVKVPAEIYQWKSDPASRARAAAVQMRNRELLMQAFEDGLAILGYERDESGNGVFLLGHWDEHFSYGT
jgi:hypothetical protein